MFEILWFVLFSSITLLIVILMLYLIDGIVTEQEHYNARAIILVSIVLFCVSAYNISLYKLIRHEEVTTVHLANDKAKHLYYMDNDKPVCISKLGEPLPNIKVGFPVIKHPFFGERRCEYVEFYSK